MMSRPPARRAPAAVTLSACLLSAGCNPQTSPSAEQDSAVANTDETPTPAPVEPSSAEGEAAELAPEPGSEDTGGSEDSETGGGEQILEPPPLESVVPPPGYGEFKFPKPPPGEEQLTLHAAAGYEVVAVYAGPSKSDEHIGFLRIGTRLRAGEKIVNDDCPRGWYALEGGGYACASRGLMVDSKPPFMSYEPKPPRVDEPFPYDWAYVRQWNTPLWWQVPNGEQLAATRELRLVREAERTGVPLPSEEPAGGSSGGGGGEGGGGGGEGGDPLPAPDGDDDGGEAAAPPPEPPPAPVDPPPAPPEPEPEEEKEPVNVPFSPSIPWLEKGYFLSLGETLREGERSYWRTARGGVVEKGNAHPYEARDYHGAELPPGVSFPVGFVMVKNGTKLLTLGKDDKLQATGKNLDKRTFLDLGEEVEIAGRAYFTVLPYPPPEPSAEGEGGSEGGEADEAPLLLVKADVMRTPDLQPVPKGLDPWDHWIDVDITKQMLVAYEGSRPVYATLVSTGKKGSDEEPFETPTGRFRIRSKQITSNMDGATATDGNYAIQDVPWVMYFQGSYALHGAFWHESFGYVRSHGCVNLGPTDARWLFYWTTPYVPQFWHGVSSSDENPGTTVVIRKS